MKKEYEAPKAERMEFDYSDVVTASSSGCHWITPKIDYNYQHCEERDDPDHPGYPTDVITG